jgi:hypothetical protein
MKLPYRRITGDQILKLPALREHGARSQYQGPRSSEGFPFRLCAVVPGEQEGWDLLGTTSPIYATTRNGGEIRHDQR